jgi:cell division protein FtsN
VILLAGAGLTGYYYGLDQATRSIGERAAGSTGDLHEGAESKPGNGDITFYSALTESRKAVPPVSTPQLAEPTTPVEADPAVPAESASATKDTVISKGSVMLQVASYKDQINAQKLLQELSSKGYAGNVVRADLGQRGVWYRVRIGPYGGEDEAGRVLEKLRKEKKLKGYVVK